MPPVWTFRRLLPMVLVLVPLWGCSGFPPGASSSPTSVISRISTLPPSWQALARTPPMGWNSFNHFGCDINENLVRDTAQAMVSSGMKDAGYQYVIIDDCWMDRERDSSGDLQPDPAKFPSGMKPLVDFVHSLGLKFGLYLDRGTKTCAGYPGSYGYELQDAKKIAGWGVDYLKYDNCSTVGKLLNDYTNMHNALLATNRPIVFSMCSWGFPGVLVPQSGIAQLWRTSSDIKDTWDSMIKIGEANNIYAIYAGPGHWNDPDMLEVGNGGMTLEEYRTHFTLWAIMAAPLIAGNDLRSMDPTIRDILTASEVIAVDQDPLGIQGTRIAADGGREIWVKPLSGTNSLAVMLLNRSEEGANLILSWSMLGLPAGWAEVRDLWARQDRGIFENIYNSNVPAHGVVLLKITSRGYGSPAPGK